MWFGGLKVLRVGGGKVQGLGLKVSGLGCREGLGLGLKVSCLGSGLSGFVSRLVQCLFGLVALCV